MATHVTAKAQWNAGEKRMEVLRFFVDGVIWKIRDPRTRAMLGGNLLDLAGFERIRTIVPA